MRTRDKAGVKRSKSLIQAGDRKNDPQQGDVKILGVSAIVGKNIA